mmetsp:Transcript_80444/g.225751  ORF Transcript_80444/g.225751 Transcript_80444/m.225751 type:complete len:293 (+) Transcript_80444:149-1027(+)
MRAQGWAFLALASLCVALAWLGLGGAGAAQGSGVYDRALLEGMLLRHRDLARNMSARIGVSEEAILVIQQRQALLAALPSQLADAEASGEARGEARGDEGAGEGEAEAEGEAEGEGEDERQKQRLEAEEKAQRELLGFDEATGALAQRFRPDFKCGDAVPALPDQEPVECDPRGEAPCCSREGWCGKSKRHCRCDLCVDYRKQATLKVTGVKLSDPMRQCERIGYGFGKTKSPEACAALAFPRAECGRKIMFSHSSPDWGCHCCAAQSGARDEEQPQWTLYTIEVAVTRGHS